ncbi:MAG: restriction endonuclease subunit S, partial [Bacteroidales bacterium]|nr:restriction endonuclease subunit S [Bacteroidales bacterium]
MVVKKGYKKTEIGVIPEDWNVKLLHEIVHFTNGKAHERFIDKYGKYIVINSKFISTEGRIKKFSNKFISPLKVGDITIVMSDIPLGKALAKCFIVDKDGTYTLNQRIGRITVKENISNKYLFYKLNRNKYYLAFDSGTGQTNLKKENILGCPVPLPPLPEQKAIAEVLSDTDNLIHSLEKLIAKKKLIKQGAMQELLTPKEGWEKKKLGEICEIYDGTHQTPKYVNNGIPFFSVENITQNNFENTKYISEKEHRLLTKKWKIERGDILMTRIGSLGDCKLVDWDVNASFYVSLALLKMKKGFSGSFLE